MGVWLSDEEADQGDNMEAGAADSDADIDLLFAGAAALSEPEEDHLQDLARTLEQAEQDRGLDPVRLDDSSSAPVPPHHEAASHRPHDAMPSEPNITRVVRPETLVSWGKCGFRITYRAPKAQGSTGKDFGSWQGTCVFHAKSSVTKCTKTLTMSDGSAETSDRCLCMVKHWLLQGHAFSRAKQHGQWNPRAHETPPAAALEAQAAVMDAPTADVVPDDELDARDARAKAKAASKAVAKAKGKAKKKAKAKGKVKAKASARRLEPKAKPVASAASDECASDPPDSDSDSSSQSSSSSGSSSSSSSSS